MKIISNSLLRSFVGFEALFDELDKVSDFKETNYPAYNIEKTNQNSFIISIAVAGFNENSINIQFKKGLLKVEALNNEKKQNIEYLHKGLAQRSFIKTFRLQNNLEVLSAVLKNGILNIHLKSIIPEEEEIKNIKIISK
mgnify:FL=1